MPPINWNAAIAYGNLASIAQSVAPSGSYGEAQIDQIKAAGYTFLEPLYGDDLATDFDPHIGDVVSFGFLAVSAAKELVAAIRGTDTILEWMHDGSFLMVPCPVAGASGMSEDGFATVYRSLRIGPDNSAMVAKDSINSYLGNGTAASVTICGYSLGAALATLLALDVALNSLCHTPTAYTFASPYTGDHTFANSYNAALPASYRIVNRLDLVPKLPPALPLTYEHVNTEYLLNPPINKVNGTIVCMHELTTYLWLMSQRVGIGTNPLSADCVHSP
jgi:hypothetical protein